MTAGTPGVFGRRPSTVRPAVGRFLAGERFQSALVGLGVLALSLLAGAAVLDPRWSELVLPGIGDKVAYLRAIATPQRAYLERRGLNPGGHWRRAVARLRQQR